MLKPLSKRPDFDKLNEKLLFPSSNRWGIPNIQEGYFDSRGVPLELYGIHRMTPESHKSLCAFFLDDYRIERAFHARWKTWARIRQYWGALTPDYSTWRDMPLAMQLWNVYRSRWCGAFWEHQRDLETFEGRAFQRDENVGMDAMRCPHIGITAQWGSESSLEFCFLGIPKAALIAVSVPDLRGDSETRRLWDLGMETLFRRCSPRALWVYGKPTDTVEDLMSPGMQASLEFVDFRLQRAYCLREQARQNHLEMLESALKTGSRRRRCWKPEYATFTLFD